MFIAYTKWVSFPWGLLIRRLQSASRSFHQWQRETFSILAANFRQKDDFQLKILFREAGGCSTSATLDRSTHGAIHTRASKRVRT
jgi:hypothetical protein